MLDKSANRKNYFINVHVVRLDTDEADGAPRQYNFSDPNDKRRLDSLIFSCINTGKGVAIELDRKEPAA